MWRDLKMWLIVRYIQERLLVPEFSDTDEKEGLYIVDEDSSKVFFYKKVLVSEVWHLGKRLYFMFFPFSLVKNFISPHFEGWGKIRENREGRVGGIISSARRENFLEPRTYTYTTGFILDPDTETKTVTDENLIRVSDLGAGFATPTGGLLYFSKKYWEIWALVWITILWIANQIFDILHATCHIFPRIPSC